MANNQNLKPFQKGDNWTGNKNGKPKGVTCKGTLTRLLNGTMTVEEAGRKLRKSKIEVLVMTLIKDALDKKNTASERIRACEVIMNRLEGRPSQSIVPQCPEIILQVSPEEMLL